MSKNITGYLINALVSAFIGLMVGVASIILNIYRPEMLLSMLQSALIGAIIGTVTRAAAQMFYCHFSNNLFRMLGLVFIIIGVGTAGVSYLFGETLSHIIVFLVIAETLGMLTAYFNHKYATQLNEGLKKKQASLSQKLVH